MTFDHFLETRLSWSFITFTAPRFHYYIFWIKIITFINTLWHRFASFYSRMTLIMHSKINLFATWKIQYWINQQSYVTLHLVCYVTLHFRHCRKVLYLTLYTSPIENKSPFSVTGATARATGMIRAGKSDPVMTAGPEKPESERFNNSPEPPRALCAPRTQFGECRFSEGVPFYSSDLVCFFFNRSEKHGVCRVRALRIWRWSAVFSLCFEFWIWI